MNNNTGDNMNEHTTSDLAGLAAREAGAPARGPTRIEEIRGRLTPKRAEDAAAWDPDADGCVCAECMRGIRLLEGFEWTNGEDVCDGCAVALIGHLRADAGYLLNELAGYQSDLLAGERALKEARRERDALTADLARARRILAVEQGREGPEGWEYCCADGVWWRKETTGRAWRGWRWVDTGKVPVWRWSCQAQTGYAEAALDALEAADRVLR